MSPLTKPTTAPASEPARLPAARGTSQTISGWTPKIVSCETMETCRTTTAIMISARRISDPRLTTRAPTRRR